MNDPKCYCAGCGLATDAPVHGEYCSTECAESAGVDTRPLSEKWAEWESERAYRCGYEYACGYRD